MAGASRYRIQTPATLDIAHNHVHDQSVLHDVLIDAKQCANNCFASTFHPAEQWLTGVLHTVLIEAKHG